MNRTTLRAMLCAVTLGVACGATPASPDSPSPTRTSRPEKATLTTLPASSHRYMVATPKRPEALPIYTDPDEATLNQWLDHPRHVAGDENTKVPLVLLVLDRKEGWVQVSLPVRPNGSTGWVRSREVEVTVHDYHIEISLGGFRLRVFRGDRPIFEAPIAVATDDAPTPGGTYYITELLQAPDPAGPYGPFAFGLSGHSEVYTSFGGGDGQLGIHGTDQPDLIGTRVSHGCIRLENARIEQMVKLGLPLGTPVVVQP